MKRNYTDITNIKYIEITEKRYNSVETKFKYVSYRGDEKHYYLARNRLSLENKIYGDESYVRSNN